MKEEIKKYLINLKEKFDDNNNYYQAYKVINNKIILIGNASTKKDLNDLVTDQLQELICEGVIYVIKISYNISLKNYLKGPLSILCVIQEIKNGKLSKKNMKVNSIYYTEDELEENKLKKNDFKLLINGLLNDTIESNPLKIYTRNNLY
jgi:hypothetical protein